MMAMKRHALLLSVLLASVAVCAADKVTMTVSGMKVTMSNVKTNVEISTEGKVTKIQYKGQNVLGSTGVYFDYTTTNGNLGWKPNKVEVVRQEDDYAEVLYSNTTDDIQFQVGYIMRTGVNGLYTYVIANGTPTSGTLELKEARVCVRTGAAYINGYVDECRQGVIPTPAVMTAVEGNADRNVQDATYRLDDGSIYTKYDWAHYIVGDSVHGLMNNLMGVWNIACSHEWLNGGPMRQELTAHATGKSPITIQMIQGGHLGGASAYYQNGERKLYGPFLIYVNYAANDVAAKIADAKEMAAQQQREWPFTWFRNSLYPVERGTVRGRLNVTTGQVCDSIRVVLAEPGGDVLSQTKNYIFWAETDAEGRFEIKHVRPGSYTLYAYALKGDITDELQQDGITVAAGEQDLGTIDWAPACYEHKLWQIGENNRMSDGYRYSDTLRSYGLWNLPPANLTYTIGESTPEKDWYYAQTKNGKWTITFDLDDTYTGTAWLTASVAGATNKPKIAVAVNGATKSNWDFPTNDAAIYRSAVLGGRHWLKKCSFTASSLKKGRNTVTLTLSGLGGNGGVMWDCIKLEVGNRVTNGIATVATDDASPVSFYTLGGQKVGTFPTFGETRLPRGLYIYRQGSKSGKIQF